LALGGKLHDYDESRRSRGGEDDRRDRGGDRRTGTIDPTRNDDDYYAAERDAMTPHLTPLVWGCGCAFVTLSSLRFGRWYRGGGGGWGGYVVGGYGGGGGAVRSSRGAGAGGYVRNDGVVDRVVVDGSFAGRSSGRRIASAADARPAPQDVRRVVAERTAACGVHDDDGAANAMHGLGTLLVDVALSLLFGMSASVFLTRRDVLMDDFVSVPLLDGESVLVEEFCGPFGVEMEAVNDRVLRVRGRRALTRRTNDDDASDHADVGGSGRVERAAAAAEAEEEEEVPYSELWKDENLGGFDSLRAVRDFVVNCREREIRRATTRLKGDANG
jgi:hypothetical protein